MIELDRVSLILNERPVLSDISVRLSERRIGIIGANGSGKSSFARCLNGLAEPTSGHVRVDGLDTVKDGKAVRRKVGFVFQNPDNQIVMPTVAEDVAFGLKALKLDERDAAERVDEALGRYGLSAYRDHPAHRLSGGQKQLLAIAGVLAMEPDWIVLDEPTTLLDLRNMNTVLRAIAALEQRVVLVTHALDRLESYDRVLVIHDGRIAADDAPAAAVSRYLEIMA
ncbi:MAG: ABC transporter ATP-binding protein [Pseudomonadota bacterium]